MIIGRFLESLPILRFWIPTQGLVVRGERVPEGKPSTEAQRKLWKKVNEGGQVCPTGTGDLRHAGVGVESEELMQKCWGLGSLRSHICSSSTCSLTSCLFALIPLRCRNCLLNYGSHTQIFALANSLLELDVSLQPFFLVFVRPTPGLSHLHLLAQFLSPSLSLIRHPKLPSSAPSKPEIQRYKSQAKNLGT